MPIIFPWTSRKCCAIYIYIQIWTESWRFNVLTYFFIDDVTNALVINTKVSGLEQDCYIFSALALQIIHSYTLPSNYILNHWSQVHDVYVYQVWLWYFNSFLPEASFCLRVLSLPASVRVGVNHSLVRAITWHSFKLESLNLNQKCKTPWFKSLLFWGWLTLTFKVKFNFKLKIDPILSLSKPLLTSYSS